MPAAKKIATSEAESVTQAQIDAQLARFTPGPKVPMPDQTRISATPYIGMAYQGMDSTKMLGDPASILKDPRPGWKYVWKKRNDKQTAAWVRSGILIPVLADEIDSTNPAAEYAEEMTPSGDKYVTWESLSLFGMPPKWVKRIYTAHEEWAIARIAQRTVQFSSDVDAATGGAYKGSVSATAKNQE